jgi:integrase/recombinase XerD
MNSKYVRCFGKGSKERIIPVGGKAIHALKKYLPIRDLVLKKYQDRLNKNQNMGSSN